MNVVKLQCKKEKNVDDDTWCQSCQQKEKKKKKKKNLRGCGCIQSFKQEKLF